MDTFNSLKKKLDANKKWPLTYMFKFIVPAEMDKIALVEALFDNNATIYHKESRSGKFISITAKQEMDSSSDIINVYQKASSIESIVAL